MSLDNQHRHSAALECLPTARKRAGIRAHLAVYRRLIKHRSLGDIFKFLSICSTREATEDAQFRIFFEVTLGKRIADCVLTVESKNQKTCYVVELKTCLSGFVFPGSAIKISQRRQGLEQLTDSVAYIGRAAPKGHENWSVRPLLLFKNQKTLKTIHTESSAFPPTFINTTSVALNGFFNQWEDARVRKMLYAIPAKTHATNNLEFLDPASKQRSVYSQTIVNGGKKKRVRDAKSTAGAQGSRAEKKPAPARARQRAANAPTGNGDGYARHRDDPRHGRRFASTEQKPRRNRTVNRPATQNRPSDAWRHVRGHNSPRGRGFYGKPGSPSGAPARSVHEPKPMAATVRSVVQ
ncbi:ORF20 [macacine gammaherpesvirus 12]|uniref:ORF20 n=1 Tax=macacine gammaherpesvirus 12 TaxID=2560571 RepID=A0A0B5D3J0_9GAMA|nr:ORF20 [Macaca nemestrina rhadinovirus 2]AJE29661.1 ORF20 [Macaca nemestrina rhadinovirus 2]